MLRLGSRFFLFRMFSGNVPSNRMVYSVQAGVTVCNRRVYITSGFMGLCAVFCTFGGYVSLGLF